MSHQPSDTRVTAYVFGELSREETSRFEHELADSSALQKEVAAIRETLVALEAEFDAGGTDLGRAQREVIEKAIENHSTTSDVRPSSTFENLSRRSWVAAVLAASLLMVCGLVFPYLKQQPGTSVSMTQSTDSTPKRMPTIDDADPFDEPSAVGVAEKSRFDTEHDFGMRPSASQSRTSSSADVDDLADLDMESTLSPTEEHVVDDLFGDTIGSDSVDKPESIEKRVPRRSQSRSADMMGMEMEMEMMEMEMLAIPENKSRILRSGADESGQGADDFMGGEAEIVEFGLGGVSNFELAVPERQSSMYDMMDMEMDDQMGGYGGGGIDAGTDGYGVKGLESNLGAMMGGGMDAKQSDPRGDRFARIEDNRFVNTSDAPLSTFSIDVDTASYAKVRALLNRNSLPRPDAVRIEEFLNYFDYGYAPPADDRPFAASMQIATCPWNPKHRLARIGIKGRVVEENRPSSNLVFLLDVSGSMDEPNKLPLVIKGMKMLTKQLTENDKVAIVVYAGAAGLILDATRGDQKQQIVSALERLKAGGSTNGGQGIVLAYQIAQDNFIVGGTNRVILCSDGDFNVGVTGQDQLTSLVKKNAKSGIFLSVLGFGIGNHNDAMMEQISNEGNGNYAFIDHKSEARKVLVEELGGTLVTIAKDVKIQIEFNPKEVSSYRLIGYENRVLAAEDFDNDKKDAGEIGAGHTVTALYEIVPTRKKNEKRNAADQLRYQKQITFSKEANSGEMLTLKLRYKNPQDQDSTLIEYPISDAGMSFSEADRDFRFAASVASFGMLLRDSPHKGNATFDHVARMAREGAKGDETGYRIEFVEMVAKARQLRGE